MRKFNLLILTLTICFSCKKSNIDPQSSNRISKVVVTTPGDTTTYTPYYGIFSQIDSIIIKRSVPPLPGGSYSTYIPRTFVKFLYDHGKLSSRIATDIKEYFYYDNQGRIARYQVMQNSLYSLVDDYSYHYNFKGELSYLKNLKNDSVAVVNSSSQSRNLETYYSPETLLSLVNSNIYPCNPKVSLTVNPDKTFIYTCYSCSSFITQEGKFSNVKINIPSELWNEIKGLVFIYDARNFGYAIQDLAFNNIDGIYFVEEWDTTYKNQFKVDPDGRIIEIYTGINNGGRKISFYY